MHTHGPFRELDVARRLDGDMVSVNVSWTF
jgi:hypothetical protein